METMADRKAKVTLPADDQICVTREFDAPPHLVYKAYTTPDLVARWWHARRGTIQSVEIDLRVGGRWRYAMTANGGFEVAFHGEFREIEPDAKLVTTEVYEGAPDSEALTSAIFADRGGRTELTLLMTYPSQAVRDMVIQTGMEAGLQDALDLLEGLAAGGE
jgi:uncharacterized protein YndB with AHSA1/START domain